MHLYVRWYIIHHLKRNKKYSNESISILTSDTLRTGHSNWRRHGHFFDYKLHFLILTSKMSAKFAFAVGNTVRDFPIQIPNALPQKNYIVDWTEIAKKILRKYVDSKLHIIFLRIGQIHLSRKIVYQ